MVYKNINARSIDKQCRVALHDLHVRLKGVSPTNTLHNHFVRYAVIVCSGALEKAFKCIIADYVTNGANAQLCEYIDRNVRQSSKNPRLDEIKKLLGEFDSDWLSAYKAIVSQVSQRSKDALKSIVDNRNIVAHGGAIGASFYDIARYYYSARIVVGKLEDVLV